MTDQNYTPLPLKQELYPTLNKGNPGPWALKFKTSEERKALCDSYCAYLKQGFPKEYFPECGPQTLANYIKRFPEDLDIEAIEDAEREGLKYLTTLGYAGMMGKIEGFREKTWMFIMQNMTRFRLKQELSGPGGSAPFIIEIHPALKLNEPKKSEVIEADVVEERTEDQRIAGEILPTSQENL